MQFAKRLHFLQSEKSNYKQSAKRLRDFQSHDNQSCLNNRSNKTIHASDSHKESVLWVTKQMFPCPSHALPIFWIVTSMCLSEKINPTIVNVLPPVKTTTAYVTLSEFYQVGMNVVLVAGK